MIVAGLTLILSLPILAVSAALLKLTSSASVLFSQTRTGCNDKQYDYFC